MGELEAVEEQPADHEAVGATRSALIHALERDSCPAKSGERGRLRPHAKVLKRRDATGEQQHPAAGQADNRPLPRSKDSEGEGGDRNTQPVRDPRHTRSGRPTAGQDRRNQAPADQRKDRPPTSTNFRRAGFPSGLGEGPDDADDTADQADRG